MIERSPGPWKRKGRLECAKIFDANDVEIAVVVGANPGGRYPKGSNGPERHERAMKNRDAIAAVPDMIAALERCTSALAALGGPNCEAAKEAFAALKKAGVKK